MGTATFEVLRLGLVEYDDGLDLQERFREGVGAGEVPDQLLLLQHPPIVTLGRNAGDENLILSPEELAARGIEFHRTGRGGDVTYHGPGQLVGYPILDLDPDRRDVRRYVRDLEETLIRTLADFDVAAGRVAGLTGVWIGDFKIAAIGVRISRWITTHGFAFNLGTDLDAFDLIVPCGIRDRGVTTLERVLGEPVAWSEVCERYVARFAEVFDRRPVERTIDSRSVQVLVWRRGEREVEVLLLKRTPDDGGFWQPVTGIVERGEEPIETARRETREETGIEGAPSDLDYVRDFRIARRYVGGAGPHPWINREIAFAMEVPNDVEVTIAADEHESFVWTTPDRAREMLRWNGNKKALARLMRRNPAARSG
jgi:lipoyl(octanoyl) transferase